MDFPCTVESLDNAVIGDRSLYLTIGMFDGVHRGHQSIIKRVLEVSRENPTGIAGALTFWPHPSALFRPEDSTPQIMNPEIKAGCLQSYGIDLVIQQTFDFDFAGIEAKAFMAFLKEKLPGLHGVFVGENFRFGKGRMGTADFLVESAEALGLRGEVCSRVLEADEGISSTLIRKLLSDGDMVRVNCLLGRPYHAVGLVERGKQQGRRLGFPTLNIAWTPELEPRYGVYAVTVRASAGGQACFTGVANYGVKPTAVAGLDLPVLEVHCLDECPFDYGDSVIVEWITFIRPEEKFASLEALKVQIQKDKKTALAFFE